MKTQNYFYVLTFFLIISHYGCKNTELLSTEESAIATWMNNNYKEIPKYNRKKVSSFPRSYQKAMLSELSPVRKKELWQDKVDYILKLNLSKEEKDYLKWYAIKFKSIDYSKITPVAIEQQMYEKTIVGMKKFGWSRKFVYQMFFSLGNLNLDKNKREKISRLLDEDRHCDCMYDLGCGFLDLRADCDKTLSCKTRNYNCGFFGNSECTGDCSNFNLGDIW